MTTRISLLLTGACVFATACGDDSRANTDANTDGGSGSVSVSGGATDADTDPTPTTTPTTTVDPSGGTPGTASQTSEATDSGTTVDPSAGTLTTGNVDTGDDPIVEVVIDPLDAIVTVVDGQIPPDLQYTAKGITMGGVEVPLDGSWGYDRLDLASLGVQSGVFSATGFAGGKGTVTFDPAGDLGAVQTSATVKLQFTSEPNPVDPGIKDGFGMAVDPDPAMVLLYPYDKTVFPRGLTGPTIQWNGTLAPDTFYIHVTSPTYELEWYGVVPPKSRWNFPTMPSSVWPKITASNDGAITTEIKRFSNNNVYGIKPQTWFIAPANLAGTVYYWEINNGKVVRLPVGASKPEKFLEEKQNTCIACHSISADGSTLSASYAGGWSPWASWNIADGKQKYYSNTSSGFTAISPSGSHVVWGHWSDGNFNTTGRLTLSVFNSVTGLAFLDPPPAGVGGGAPSHPAWSPDGNKLAFAVRTNGNGLDFTASTLWITDVDTMNPAFTNTKQIVDAVGWRPTTTFPTFLPDSKWIAFERATQARTRGAAGELYLTDTNGDLILALDRANGKGIISDAQASTSYEPTFLPVAVGGYAWLVLGSERMYGNTLEDQNVNTRKKQLWVAAIDLNPKPGEDPSHPAFWLPGQELNNQNMRGAWALSPCKADGATCSAGFDCCAGYCYGQPGTCHDQPLDNCSHITEKCDSDADCCNGENTDCIGGFCSLVPN